jgi:hypothetical protein
MARAASHWDQPRSEWFFRQVHFLGEISCERVPTAQGEKVIPEARKTG